MQLLHRFVVRSALSASSFASLECRRLFFFAPLGSRILHAVLFVPLPCVNLRKAIALVSVDSAITAGFSDFRFPFSVFGFLP